MNFLAFFLGLINFIILYNNSSLTTAQNITFFGISDLLSFLGQQFGLCLNDSCWLNGMGSKEGVGHRVGDRGSVVYNWGGFNNRCCFNNWSSFNNRSGSI